MLFSIKMRSSKGGPHEKGGKHISGFERILQEDEVESELINMYKRAREHEKGDSDFINIKIEKVNEEDIICYEKLDIVQHQAETKEEGLELVKNLLLKNNIDEKAINKGINSIIHLKESMHGAMLIDKDTGERLDNKGKRGVRVTGMGSKDIKYYKDSIKNEINCGAHLEEALILASKVANCRGVIAELCWSDDPNYVTGYVGTKNTYERIPVLKEKGNSIGGRIFFIDPSQLDENYNINEIIDYLENQVVLIE